MKILKKVTLFIFMLAMTIIISGCSSKEKENEKYGEEIVEKLEEKYNKDFELSFVSLDKKVHVRCTEYPDFAFLAYENSDEFANGYHCYQESRKVDDALDKNSFTYINATTIIDDIDLIMSSDEFFKDAMLVSVCVMTNEKMTLDEVKKVYDLLPWLKNNESSQVVNMIESYTSPNYDTLDRYRDYKKKSAINYTDSPFYSFDSHNKRIYKYNNITGQIEEK